MLQHCWQEEVIRISRAWWSHSFSKQGAVMWKVLGCFLAVLMNTQQPSAEMKPGQKSPEL